MEQPRVLVAITSYNRQDELITLCASLQDDEHQSIIPDIAVFDDCTPSLTIFRGPGIKIIQSPEHRGKAGFWKTYNDIFAYCKEHEYDYYIILPDDVEPCPDFVAKAIEAYDKAGCICLSPLLTNRSLLPGISRWGMKPIVLRDWGYETSYFDCCTICRRDFFEAMNWKMYEILPSSNPFRSSGVGRQITTRLQAANKRMGHVRRTLLAIAETESQMNPQERIKYPMYADWRDNEPCVDVHMAALWRGGHVVKTAESLLQNPELLTLFVTLNSFTPEQFKAAKYDLKVLSEKYGRKIVVRKGKNAKGSNEKLAQLPKSKAKYIAFADDDILYPENHLHRLICGVNVHNAAVSLHGSTLSRWPIRKYYFGDRQMHSWNIGLAEDTRADLIGTGVAMLKREWFTDEELKALYVDAPATSMDDIIVSCLLSQKGIERWVLEHQGGCIRLKEKVATDNYVYDTYRDNDSEQVEYVNNHFKR